MDRPSDLGEKSGYQKLMKKQETHKENKYINQIVVQCWSVYILNCYGVHTYIIVLFEQANTSEPLNVDLAVLDQYLTTSASELKSLFPEWADVTAFSTFYSTYRF